MRKVQLMLTIKEAKELVAHGRSLMEIVNGLRYETPKRLSDQERRALDRHAAALVFLTDDIRNTLFADNDD